MSAPAPDKPTPRLTPTPGSGAGVSALRPIALRPMVDRPRVSVLLTSHNYGRYVEAAIDSVLGQGYRDLELIVVDDGSTDDSRQRIRRRAARDGRVVLIEQTNQGMAAALNAGFARSRGEVVCLLDADDCFRPDKLERVVDYFAQHPRTGMLQHPLQVVDAAGRPVQVIPFLSRLERGWLAPTVLRRGGRWSCMPTSALSFRREVARWLLPIDARRYWISADALLFTVGPLLSRVGVIDQPLAEYRVHGRNHMSSGRVDRQELRKRLRSYHDTLTGSNQHIRELGLAVPRLEARDHVLYREQLFALSMLRNRRAGVWRRYAALVAALWRDDMYGLAQKGLALPVYGLLPLLPPRCRGPWLDRVRTYGRLKATAQALLGTTKDKRPTRDPAEDGEVFGVGTGGGPSQVGPVDANNSGQAAGTGGAEHAVTWAEPFVEHATAGQGVALRGDVAPRGGGAAAMEVEAS